MLYLVVSTEALSLVLVRTEGRIQLPIYYVSEAILLASSQYTDIEKLVLFLIMASKKSRAYF